MAATTGTKIVKDGLVLNIDAANVGKNAGLTSVQYLIVAGGGGGGCSSAEHRGGGGGAGGVLLGVTTVTPQGYTISVGSGGASRTGTTKIPGNDGTNSSALGFTAIGGGGGAGGSGGPARVGGSGGGGHYRSSPTTGANGTPGQGHKGGNSVQSVGGGGGGGAAEPGFDNGAGPKKQFGGNGLFVDWADAINLGDNGFFAGGGGSGENPSYSGSGGLGGGGAGATTNTNNGSPGQPNTGGGGGGTRNGNSGAGGSGIVIIRYPGPQRAIGGTVTQVDGNTIHTFTTVGNSTFEPLTYVNNTAFAAVPDLSNNGNIGTAANGPVYNGDNGGNFVFDGVNDYGDVGSVTPDIGDFTVGFIYQLTGAGGRGGLFERRAAGAFNGFSLGQGGPNSWMAMVSGTSNFSNSVSVNFTYPALNTWYYDVCVYSNENTLTNYRNGTFVSSSTGVSQGNLSAQGTRTNLLIANRDFVTSLPCKVALINCYNRALTAQEIAENFEATRGRYGI